MSMNAGSTSAGRHAGHAHAQVLYDPLADGPASYKTYLRWTKRRSTVRLLFALVCVATLLLLGATKLRQPAARLVKRIVDPPPLYGEWHRAELALPQHNAARAFDGGKKYLLVNNHVAGESVLTQVAGIWLTGIVPAHVGRLRMGQLLGGHDHERAGGVQQRPSVRF